MALSSIYINSKRNPELSPKELKEGNKVSAYIHNSLCTHIVEAKKEDWSMLSVIYYTQNLPFPWNLQGMMLHQSQLRHLIPLEFSASNPVLQVTLGRALFLTIRHAFIVLNISDGPNRNTIFIFWWESGSNIIKHVRGSLGEALGSSSKPQVRCRKQ